MPASAEPMGPSTANVISSSTDPMSSTTAPKGPVVCVFCGSSPGTSPTHLHAARALATLFYAHSITLIYGGGTTGLMGELARTLVSLSGPSSVHGIIPAPLIKYEQNGRASGIPPPVSQNAYGRVTVVKDMHSRKQLMAQSVMNGGPGSGFVALSGGYGTVEELMEMVTWNQLGIHRCPIVVFNVEGYYDGLLAWVRASVEGGFVSQGNRGIMVEAASAEGVVRALGEYVLSEERFALDWTEN
ncbi:hypothetical protein MMC30_007109 [Trapelia coarctata]|nr:hypothetical protein [Trapelia coarctata]